MSSVSSNELRAIVTDANSVQLLVEVADQLGQELSKTLTTSQIRALFGEVRQIQAAWGMDGDSRARAYRRMVLLKPKMAYRARKEGGRGVRELVDVLSPALDFVIAAPNTKEQDQNFKRFVEFFEAILAYHKAAGGK